jgi:adenylate kinase family enzyme
MHRILVGGSSGAGKTTMAKALAKRLSIPHIEVDGLFHGPGWVPRPEFVDDVDAATSGPAWVIDHDYAFARHLVWSRIDTFVWLDYSRAVCEWRVLRRSVPRGLLRRELWNGNRENFFAMFVDPEHPVRWSWTHHAGKRASFEARVAEPANAHITTVRLRRPRDGDAWLRSVSPS